MRPHAWCAALVTLLASFAARADDVEPVVAHASFHTTTPPTLDVVTTEACGLRPVLATRRVAVSVGDRACSSNGPSTGVALVVRVLRTNGGADVVLDATAPDDAAQPDLQDLVDEAAERLRMRVWRKLVHMSADREQALPSPPQTSSSLYAAGVVTIAVSAVAGVVGLGLEVVSLFKGWQGFGYDNWCNSCEDHTGEMVATGLLIGALVMSVAGGVMVQVGKNQSPAAVRVSAGVSPMGGSLKVTF